MNERGKTLFRAFAGGFALLFACTLILFIILVAQTLGDQREADRVREEFERQQAAWQALDIDDYTVRVSNCNGGGMCCQNTDIRVANGYTIDPLPACGANFSGFNLNYTYRRLATMDETYDWLDSFLRFNTNRRVSVIYDDDLHYIREVRLTPLFEQDEILIQYEDLRPLGGGE